MKTFKLFFAVAVCLLAGFIGSIFTAPSIPIWYAGLNKPFFTPPDWIFAPVWTLLYVMMGIAAYIIWDASGNTKEGKTALKIFTFQLLLNTLWSIIFFGFKSLLFGAIEIVVLWVAVLLTIKCFYRISKPAAWLLFPYLLWGSFATVLTITILFIN